MTLSFSALIALLLIALLAGLVAGLAYRRHPVAPPDPRRHPDYLSGIGALIDRRPEAALRHLTAAADAHSDLLEVYLALGALYRQQGLIDRAIHLHESLLARADLKDHERFEALLALGRDFRAGGFMDRAIRTYEQAVALRPRSSLALGRLARLYAAVGDLEPALKTETRRRRRERQPAALAHYETALAERAEAAGDAKTAGRFFRAARRHHPPAVAAWLGQARLSRAAGKAEAGRRFLERYAARFPERGVAVLPLLRELTATPAQLAAWEWLAQRLLKEAGSSRAGLLLIEHYYDSGKIAEAAQLAAEIIRHRPRLLAAHRVWQKLMAAGALPPEQLRSVAAGLAADERLSGAWVCLRCAYEVSDLAARCPSCKAWDSLVETPA